MFFAAFGMDVSPQSKALLLQLLPRQGVSLLSGRFQVSQYILRTDEAAISTAFVVKLILDQLMSHIWEQQKLGLCHVGRVKRLRTQRRCLEKFRKNKHS
jgi:hypothetical protein